MAPERRDVRYQLIERIAVGGMAEVFRAHLLGASGFAKPVAVKRILPHLAADRELVARFVAEARIAVTLAHPNIVSVFELSRFGESLYIAMEYVDGPDLATLVSAARRSGAPLPLGPALHVAGELLRGLEHAHEHGVIHRDVSPSNVLVSEAGEVKITDFGIAKAAGFDLTGSRRVMGKWPYLSPEQAEGEALDHRSDVFSAGAVIYELLCGRRLFGGNTTSEIADAIRHQPIERPSALRPEITEPIDRALLSMLERDREQRAAGASAALELLSEMPLELSRRATAAALAAEIARLCPPRHQPAAPAQLIDDIINSELAHARDGRRVTVQTGAHQTGALGFVRAGTEDDVGQWLLGDATGTYTLDQTVQLFALPVAAPERRASGRRLPLLIILASLICAAVIAALLLTRDQVPAATTADARTAARPSPRASLTVTTEPAGAAVTLFGEHLGTTPIRDLEIAARAETAELVITRPGFETIRMRIDLAPGALVRIARDLEPEPR